MSNNDESLIFQQSVSHTPPQLDLPEIVPESIGPYKIESFLQKGGMGLLYLGTDPLTKEPCTIKVLNPRFLNEPEIVMRFLREAEILSLTDHPNIVKLLGWGSWECGYYIALEFVQGISLRQTILQTPLSLKRSIEMIIEIAYAVCHLHIHGIIHRDLKPENILVADSGRIKVIDFGIAQLVSQSGRSSSQLPPRFIGTPIYISPEQQRDPDAVSYSSDVYSLGIIAYELILGKLSMGQIHLSLMPKGIQRILAKSLQKNPEDRYPDIVDLITDLASYLHSSNLEKEKQSTDHLSELNENLRNMQKILHPSPLQVAWGDIGCALHNTWKGSELFFLQKNESERFTLLVGEVIAPAAEAIIRASSVQGSASVLLHMGKTLDETFSIVNDLLISQELSIPLGLFCLIGSIKNNVIQYTSCGYGSLWFFSKAKNTLTHLPMDNSIVGVSKPLVLQKLTCSWSCGDSLVLVPRFAQYKEGSVEAFINDTIMNTIHLSSQKQAEAILRKLKAVYPKSFQENSLGVFVIRRSG